MPKNLLHSLLSGDYPRSKPLAAALVVILVCLAFAPFVFPGSQPPNVAAKICIFIILVASYDLLLGYTGIVSFAHTMFYGIGCYGVPETGRQSCRDRGFPSVEFPGD